MAPSSPASTHPWWTAIVCGMASYIDAAALITWSVALVIYQEVLGLTPVQIGILSGLLTTGIAVGSLVGGRMGDQFGRRSVFLVTMAAIAAGAAAMIFAAEFPMMVVGTILVGLAGGADLPVSLSTISEAAPERSRGRMIGFSQLLWIVGSVVPGLLAAGVAALGRGGGQILFSHLAIAAVVVFVARLTIPESALWLKSRDERRAGIATTRADRASVKDLFRAPYAVPFFGLVLFFGLFTTGGNTVGQYSTYLLVNGAGVSVETASVALLAALPVALGGALGFMKVVGGRRRFAWFTAGGIMVIAAFLLPAVAGLTLTTFLISLVLMSFGGAFASDSIMKFWTQRSFPTLLRTTAQGAIIAVARFGAAGFAFVAPLIIEQGPSTFYFIVAVLVTAGLMVGWLVFRTRDAHDEFRTEDEPDNEPIERPELSTPTN
ncbi:MFS transporter [Microbacterium sp. NPDC058345]|uniref:MFS transporter n=1 Tax=Microbacterium sp. NPDC058345 TaxID=3346455 RepID=UPI00366280ED